jgi:hypothetical protein
MKNAASQGHFSPKKIALTGKILISVASAIVCRPYDAIWNNQPYPAQRAMLGKKAGLQGVKTAGLGACRGAPGPSSS